jgi:hypothetical protein
LTYYDTWSRWDEATQEQRDAAKGCKDGLWKDFAVRVSLEKTRLKVARQRVLWRQRTAEAEEVEESDGSVESIISLDGISVFSSD